MGPIFFPTPAGFRAWLAAHHETKSELLVGYYKKGSGKPSMTWPESVDEALCFGWIDGVRRNVSEDSYSIRFTPRKATSTWSLVNVGRVRVLTAEGRMTPSGHRAFAARVDKKTGTYSFERTEETKLSPTEEASFRANRKATEFFDKEAPWYRRTATHWVISAKRDDTRAKRLARLIADSAAGAHLKHLARIPSPRKSAEGGTRKAPSARAGAKAGGVSSEAATRFAKIVDALKGKEGVSTPAPTRRAFGSNALKVNGKIFAMFTQETLVVKLPEARAAALVGRGSAAPFDPGHGRRMKQWVAMTEASSDDWTQLAREAMTFVRG